MSALTAAAPLVADKPLLISGVNWATYTKMLRAFAEQPGYRLTYDRGELEIMPPMLRHDDDGRVLGLFVYVLTDELGLPLKHGGSTTLRRRAKRRGIESDDCFWIANAHRMAGRNRLNLGIDPPPDLAIEVDVTSSSMDRMAIYAALRVPEVWRVEWDTITYYVVGSNSKYATAGKSKVFPLLTPDDLFSFLKQAREAVDQNIVARRFRAWVRRQKR